jgi:hypothetical protein
MASSLYFARRLELHPFMKTQFIQSITIKTSSTVYQNIKIKYVYIKVLKLLYNQLHSPDGNNVCSSLFHPQSP